MKEITVKEFVQALEGKVIELESVDVYGVSVHMTKAGVDYDEELDILTFGTGDYKHGISSIAYGGDDIDCIDYDESDNTYTIQFSQLMPDVSVATSGNKKKIAIIK